jgi:hypothetical protein
MPAGWLGHNPSEAPAPAKRNPSLILMSGRSFGHGFCNVRFKNGCRRLICPASEQIAARHETDGTLHMKHRVTRDLFEYWDVLRGDRAAPDRGDIEPGAIPCCLANVFVLAFDAQQGHPFRIAGTMLCDMFGAELARKPFAALWSADAQPVISDLIGTVAQEKDGVVAGVTGQNGDARTADLEMILLPLSADAGATRILGALSAVSAPYWLGHSPLQSLRLGNVRYTGARGADRLASARRMLLGPGVTVYPAATASN